MTQGDSGLPNNRTPNSGSRAQDSSRDDRERGEAAESRESVDFGSYVSSTVRSSAERFGTPARSAPARGRRNRPSQPAPADAPDTAPASSSTEIGPSDDASRSTRDRPRTYWRDSVGNESTSPRVAMSDPDEPAPAGVFGWSLPEDQRTRRALFGGIALALLAIIAIIWLLARGGGGDDPPPATGTAESVLNAPPVATEPGGAAADSTPSGSIPFIDEETPVSEPTEAVRRGGDNQIGRDDGTPDATGGVGGNGALSSIDLGPVARQCPEQCLVRVRGGEEMLELMTTAGTRPSFRGEGFSWVIASPEGIALFEQRAETTLVSISADTLSLYVAKAPDDAASDAPLQQFGTVLDSAGAWSLLEAPSVPAIVKPLTDWGYEVSKLLPAPPDGVAEPEEPTNIGSIEIGSLLDDVDANAIERSMTDLVAMGSTDGSGVGTRYYTRAGNMQAAEYLFQQLESLGLEVWYEDFLSWEGYLMVNVIGEIPGRDASSIYGVMAHFDTISEDFAVSPGADDNATGVAGALEIARILRAYELTHPVRVVFVNVEEVGIVGSEQFAKRAKAEGIPYRGVFNLDSIGAQRQYGYLVLNGSAETRWMSDLFAQLNDAYGLNQAINAQSNEAIVADDNRLRASGIDSMMIARELYGQSPYHHTAKDRMETVSLDGVVSCTQLTLLALASLAQGES